MHVIGNNETDDNYSNFKFFLRVRCPLELSMDKTFNKGPIVSYKHRGHYSAVSPTKKCLTYRTPNAPLISAAAAVALNFTRTRLKLVNQSER